MAKKTIEQLDAQIKATEERLRKQKQERAKATEAERKRQSAEIIKAVDEWNATRREPIPRDRLAETFRAWADKQRQK